MSKDATEKKNRPVAELNVGQLVVRLGTWKRRLAEIDEKITALKAFRGDGRYRERALTEMRAKRRTLENTIASAQRRLDRLRREPDNPRNQPPSCPQQAPESPPERPRGKPEYSPIPERVDAPGSTWCVLGGRCTLAWFQPEQSQPEGVHAMASQMGIGSPSPGRPGGLGHPGQGVINPADPQVAGDLAVINAVQPVAPTAGVGTTERTPPPKTGPVGHAGPRWSGSK